MAIHTTLSLSPSAYCSLVFGLCLGTSVLPETSRTHEVSKQLTVLELTKVCLKERKQLLYYKICDHFLPRKCGDAWFFSARLEQSTKGCVFCALIPFDLSLEDKRRDGFAQSRRLLRCLETHQTPDLPAALQRLFHFSRHQLWFVMSWKRVSCLGRKFLAGVGELIGTPEKNERAALPRSWSFLAASYLFRVRFCQSLHKQTEYLDYSLIWTQTHTHYIPLSH